METLSQLYKPCLGLLTDLYQLTMAYGYWKVGVGQREAVFHILFRKNPFNGGYAIACGLHHAIEYLRDLKFDASDLEYLATLKGNDDRALFDPGFLDALGALKLKLDVDAVPEGTVVFASEPLVRVQGPMLAAQIVETALLNMINFQTLIATKAARICQAARGEPVIEFGLRRAQGIDGGMAASRAAYVGGCAATSNVLAGKLFDIPVGGTHAHSWVMSFTDEIDAFDSYAAALPNNCVFLVDTYNTLQGVRHAVRIGKKLRNHGHEMIGIRLDSGDLAYLSIEARKILDQNDFPNAKILASNDLDEYLITSLKNQDAKVNVWGVGTRLATAFDQPALGGIYKLGAIRDDAGKWQYKLKLSEQSAKISVPGVLQVRRFSDGGIFVADAIYNDGHLPVGDISIVDPTDMTRRRMLSSSLQHEDLLVPIFRAGELVYTPPTLIDTRKRVRDQLSRLHPGTRRFENPHTYPVGLERNLHELRTELILKAARRVLAFCSTSISSVPRGAWARCPCYRMIILKRASGCMFGLAIGDALAAPTEFLSVEEIVDKFGPFGPAEPSSQVTDDTQMSLAVAEALLETEKPFAPLTLERSLRERFISWSVSPENDRAPGAACMQACERLADGEEWIDATALSSKGCGANMRVAPVGILPCGKDGVSERTRAAIAQFQAALTHAHPTALAAADLTCAAIVDLASGGDVIELSQRLRDYCESQRTVYHHEWLGGAWRRPEVASPEEFIAVGWDDCLAMLDRIDVALSHDLREIDPCEETGAGWIAEEAFATALLCFLMYPEDPVSAVRRAAVTSGDSDSIACITGAFCGAHLGLGAWPREWVKRIEYRQRLQRIGEAWDGCW